jgi:hypothetical protein
MRKVSISEGRRYLAAWGNENILKNHVCYFEKRAEEEIENNASFGIDVSLSYFPNFAVWLRLYSELICNALYWKVFRHDGDEEIFRPGSQSGFRVIRDSALEKIRQHIDEAKISVSKEELGQMTKSMNLVLNLRHSFQHGGLPNLLRELSDDCKEIEFYNMLIPNKFLETKKIFESAESLIRLLPQPSIAFK